jgi:hypothetical protein
VSRTKVVVLFTTNPTKLSLHFSKFSTIFYAIYNFQQIGYTIEDALLRLDPWKELGPSNWVPRPKGRPARRNPAALAMLPATGGVGVDHMLTRARWCSEFGRKGTRRRRTVMAGGDGRGVLRLRRGGLMPSR